MYGERKLRYSLDCMETCRGDRNDRPPRKRLLSNRTNGIMYFLNTDFWKLVLNKNKNFSWTSEKTPTDQDAYVRQLLTMGNLICTQPRLQGAIINLT
jgi:hypothetical protein